MHRITKEFGLDYGHRVWSQTLNKDYSLDDCLVCRHLHGHRMALFVELEAQTLEAGMVTDFKHLNWFKQWLDDVVDHKFIIDKSDPLFEHITHKCVGDVVWDASGEFGFFELDPKEPVVNELTESFVVVKFVPTSENLSKWFHGIVQSRMEGLGVKVSKITMMETPKSSAEYTA